MQARTFLSAALGALALGLAATSAQAVPAGGNLATLKADVADAGQVEKVTYGYGYRRHYGHYGYYRHYGWDYPYWRRHRNWY